MTKVSIIIPSYRQPKFLSRAIESCLEQDHTDLEVIIVEDRSQDASLGLALSYAGSDSRVRVIECGANGGLGKARNIGVAHSTGELLCFLDSDDYLLDRSISARLDALPEAMAQHGEAVVGVYGDWQHVGEDVDQPELVRDPRPNMPLVSSANYSGENVFICSAPLVRRDAVLAAGGFPEGLPMLEDFALWAKIIAAGGVFVPVGHVVATYRQRANSMLRGDGVVVMADYVDVINGWATDSGVRLADGGALAGWLGDEAPDSYGRMSWTLPSILGNFASSAEAKNAPATAETANVDTAGTANFMNEAAATGLAGPDGDWTPTHAQSASTRLVIGSLKDAIDAVAIVEELGAESVEVAAQDPRDWATSWPLALGGIALVSTSEGSPEKTIDLGDADNEFAGRDDLTSTGIEMLWGHDRPRAGSVVHVSQSLLGYPALDGWVATALQALADAGLEPSVMCDPVMREHVSGFRWQLLDVDALLQTSLVVTSAGPHLSLIEELAPTTVFAPSAVGGSHSRTRAQLDQVIRARAVGTSR